MSLAWRAVVAALESAAAACAALNLAFFLYRFASPRGDTPSRRAAAIALALVSLGAMIESAFALASVWSPDAAQAPWVFARAVPIAGTAAVSALVLRRLADE